MPDPREITRIVTEGLRTPDGIVPTEWLDVNILSTRYVRVFYGPIPEATIILDFCLN